ncbi:MAG TPA: hypothetical protein PLS51_11400 [Flavobacterium sp.]|nr:hypothetical protein [Flavobacterium sp.]HPJ11228.1 hypothetical protein [Flavobacterium sp.]
MKKLTLILSLWFVLLLAGCSSDDAPTAVTPVLLPPMTWKTVSAGEEHTAAIRSDGSLWTWGSNEWGQLGNGNYLDSGLPQRIGTDTNWKAISCGRNHVIALKTNGTIWAWGANDYKQLGTGVVANSVNHPVQIGSGSDWTMIASKNNHTVAVKSNGTTWNWGNYNYNPGYDNGNPLPMIPTPTQFASGNWQAITASDASNLLLKSDGTLWGNGRNSLFELAHVVDDRYHILYETPIQIGTENNWKTVNAGHYHVIATKTDGTLWSWGWVALGLGSSTIYGIPKQIGTANNWLYAANGIAHSMAIRTDGTIWSWGGNSFGQLANGAMTSASTETPQQIGTDADWVAIYAGHQSSFAKKSDSSLWAWGKNAAGQLGNGDTVSSAVPILIACPQ